VNSMDMTLSENNDVTMRELSLAEIDVVGGGVSSDTAYGVSVGAAVGLLALGVAASPILAAGGIALFVGGSIAASSMAIYYALQ
jgi:hypothetical protein